MATNANAAAPANASADTAHGGPATRCVMSQFSRDLRASGARMPTYPLPGSFADHARPATTATTSATTSRITGITIMDSSLGPRGAAAKTVVPGGQP